MENVNGRQVGGSHYQVSPQPWDFIEDNRLSFLEGCVVKYVTRCRRKGTHKQDLEKAAHFVEKILSRHLDKGLLAKFFRLFHYQSKDASVAYCEAHDLVGRECAVVLLMAGWRTEGHLRLARKMLYAMAREV
jgi:hypothetical protein